MGQTHSTETIKKLRLIRIKEIEIKNNLDQVYPNYSSRACRFFDYLNNKFNLNGKHAENGGEFYIQDLGYWVDYYEPDLNMVIEWDEERHYYKNGGLKTKDKDRQREITNHLNCVFLRIKQSDIVKEF
jgi:very-short-patch-repair endonuclease